MHLSHRLSVAIGLIAVSLTSTAAADISGGILGGYGLPPGSDNGDLFRIGYGARAGFTLPVLPLYFGAQSTFHLGSKDDEPGVEPNKISYHGLEAGLDLTWDEYGLRPYAMGGAAIVDSSRDVDGGFTSVYFGLGVTPSYTFVDLPLLDLYIGLDLRAVGVLTPIDNGDNETQIVAFPVYAQIGARLF